MLIHWAPAGYFAMERLNVLIFAGIILGTLGLAIARAASGQGGFIRRIDGISAIDTAVGRAAEMGRSVVYCTGMADMDEMQTLASLSVLSHVSKLAARTDTPLFCPMSRPFVMTIAQEIVGTSYYETGRADRFRQDRIQYLTVEQFGYAAGVAGIISREQPAACFFMGKFSAESLLLAETGATQGAFQVGGTAEIQQIPFFVVACDYTLIGEELFAASAYFSRLPREIGALHGIDLCKLLIIGYLLLTAGLLTAGRLPGLESHEWLTAAATFLLKPLQK
jgi:hypothetical protein